MGGWSPGEHAPLLPAAPSATPPEESPGAPSDIVDVGTIGRPVPLLPGGAPNLGLDAVVARDGRRKAAAHGGDVVRRRCTWAGSRLRGKQEP